MLRRFKWLSLLLVFSIMFLAVAPQITMAASNGNSSGSTAQPPSAIMHKNVTRLGEIVDKRDQHSKTYLNSDGSYTVETSYASRHYQDAQGKWQDISSKIISSDDSAFASRNEANSFLTYFANNSQSNFLTKMKVDKSNFLAWSLNNVNNSTATKDTYSVTYPNILQSTDLQYQPFSDGLKENIILKDTTTPASFSFQLTAVGLTVAPQSDGSLAVKDAKTGNIEYVIPHPYMYDKNQITSQAVTMNLTPTQNPNVYTVTVTPDAAWLSDPNRVFPVVIDPSITTKNWATDIGTTGIDTYVNSGTPDTPLYSSTTLDVGGQDNGGTSRAFIKFTLPTLPAGAIATDAIFSLYKTPQPAPPGSEEIDVSRVTSSWPYNITWNNPNPQPTIDTSITEQAAVNVAGNTSGFINFNVWSIVKGWLNGSLPNYGFRVAFKNENDPYYQFISSNDPTYGTTRDPYLSLTYILDETGSNPYWSYANISGGSVNTFNGNFISSVTDFSLPGRGIPINVTRTYNSRGTLNGLFGQKWFSNLDMQLQFPKNITNKVYAAILLDSSGTERPFMLNSDGKTYTRPDNYPVQLYMDTSGTSTVYHLQEANIETNQYSKNLPTLTFDSTGKLIKLEDGKGNTTNITWTSSSVIIKDPSGRTTTLNLYTDGSGLVHTITTSENSVTKANYNYTNGYLTSVMYDNSPNGTSTINYEWDVYHNLLSFTDKKGTKTYLYYDANNRVITSGPVNSLANPSFETTADGTTPDIWTASVSQDAGSVKVSSAATKYAGHSLDIKSVYQSGTSGTSKLWTKQRISVQPNTAYTLSSYIKTAGLAGIAYLNVEELDANGTHIRWEDTSGNPVTGTTDWTQKKLVINPTSATTAFLDVYVEVTHDPNSFGGDAYFDGVQLQDGTTATSFQGHTDFRYGTDGAYQAVWVTKAAGEVTEYKNNNFGNPAVILQDPAGQKAETDMVWSAADHLLNLTTPNQVALKNQGLSYGSYSYTYDPLGNPLTATDPLGHMTKMEYYYSRLKTLTQPDTQTVTNVWDPLNLNLDTGINQTLNSTAYTHDPATGNLIAESNQLGLADNRIDNSGFESSSSGQPTDWTAYSPSGTTANQVEWDSTAPFGGSYVLHINPGSNPNAYQWTNNISVDPNYSYTLSGYIRSNAASNGACLNIYWYDGSGNPIGNAERYFNVESNQWQPYILANFTPPSGAAYARVMAITYGPFDGYFDNIQLEQSPQARGYNYLENSSFFRGNTRWNFSDSNATITNDGKGVAFTDTYDGKVSRSTTGTSYLESQASPTLNQGQPYTIYGFMKTSGITAGSGGGARIHVEVTDSNNQVKDYSMPYPVTESTDAWTKYSFSFTPTASGKAQIRLELTNAIGTVSFDDIRFSPGNMITQTSYDGNNNYVASITDQLNRKTTFSSIDKYGQPLTVTSPSGAQMNYTYDGQERLLSATDNSGNTANYALDANGSVTGSSLTAGTSHYNQSTFAYDVRNNLTTETDADGKVTSYQYDEGGRLTSKTLPSGSTETFSYDSMDRVSQIQLSDGTKYTYVYDLEGHPKEIKTYSGATVTSDLVYTFDAMGNLIGYLDGNAGTVPSSSVVLDNMNRMTQFNLVYGGATIPVKFPEYTGNGLPSKVSVDNQNFSFIYDDGDKLINRNNPDSTQDIYTYNDANQVTGVQTVKVDTSNGTSLVPQWSSQYTFDADGRIETVSGTRPLNSSFNESYTYNSGTEKLNRLTDAVITESGTTVFHGTYQYDPAGNITSMSVPSLGTETFTYNADNQINSSGFSYDANGNLTTAAMYGTTFHYSYDAENRLTSVKDTNNNLIASYAYDGAGNRISKTDASGTTTNYHYFNGQLMYETVGSTITALYLRSADGKLLGVRLNQNGTDNYYYYHYDAQGNVAAVTDASGNLYRQYVYDPYGNIISVKDKNGTSISIDNDPGFNNAYTYRGYRFDSESGLYFLNSRYYAAGIGRFLTKDSVKGVTTDPQSLNDYAYAEGDPVNRVDPSGHAADETGDPNHPYVSIGAGPADTGKLEFSNSSPTNSRTSENQKNGINNANKLLSTITGAIADAKLTDIASGSTQAILKKAGPVAALFLGFSLNSDYENYSGYGRWLAMTITGAGFVVGIGTTSIALAFLFPAGASVLATVAVGTAIGVPIGLGTDEVKRWVLGK